MEQVVSTQFISTERDHVIEIMEKLAKALPVSVMADRENPLIVGVRGARMTGKSLIPFVFRETLLGDKARFVKGRREYDEIWGGKLQNGTPAEICFFNLVWSSLSYSRSLQKQFNQNATTISRQSVAEAFFARRSKGGITFVSHANLAKVPEGMTIEVIKEGIPHHFPKNKNLSLRFLNAVCNNISSPWLRMIKISVTDPRLLENRTFIKALSEIRPIYQRAPAAEAPRRRFRPAPAALSHAA